jgi:hypothetical protein
MRWYFCNNFSLDAARAFKKTFLVYGGSSRLIDRFSSKRQVQFQETGSVQEVQSENMSLFRRKFHSSPIFLQGIPDWHLGAAL